MGKWTAEDEQRHLEAEHKRITEKSYGWLGQPTALINVGEYIHYDDEWWLVVQKSPLGKSGTEIALVIKRNDKTQTLVEADYSTFPTTADPSTAIAKSLVDEWDEGRERDYPENEAYLAILREREQNGGTA